jgi:acetolactate synthase-1/2/3 large subunit
MADTEREVALVIGDGAMLYNPIVQSLSAARTLDLPILIVVFNNRQYRSMKLNHLRFYPDGVAVREDDFRGVDLDGQPELAKVAESLGVLGLSLTEPEELKSGLAQALAGVRNGVSALVDVRVTR